MTRLGVLLGILFLTGCGTNAPPQVVVGHIAPLRGPDQAVGKSAQRAIRLAVHEWTEADKKTESPVLVLHANATGEAACQGEAVRLKNINHAVALLGGQNDREVIGLDRAGLPVVSPSGMRTAGMTRRVFLTGLSPQLKGRALGEFAAAQNALSPTALSALLGFRLSPFGVGAMLSATKLAINVDAPTSAVLLVDMRGAENTLAAEAFAQALHKHSTPRPGAKDVCATWTFAGADQLADLLKRLPDEKPGIVFFAGEASAVGKVRQAMATVPLFFVGPEGSLTTLLASRQTDDNIVLATAWVADANTALNRKFVDNYTKQFGEAPSVHAALAFDGARLLAEALRQSGDALAPADIRDKLAGLKEVPLLTTNGSIDDHGQLRRPAYLVHLRQGQAVNVRVHDSR